MRGPACILLGQAHARLARSPALTVAEPIGEGRANLTISERGTVSAFSTTTQPPYSLLQL
jgi:hypothetical protein